MINIEELRADIEAGTPGDISSDSTFYVRGVDVGFSHCNSWEVSANSRRLLRLPQLEREYLVMREVVSLWGEIMQHGIFEDPAKLLRAQELTAQAMKGETQ